MSITKDLFVGIGLSVEKAEETLKNASLAKSLECSIREALKHVNVVDWSVGKFLYNVASRVKSTERLRFVSQYIATGKIASDPQTTAAMEYFKAHPLDPIDVNAFEEACGVGVLVTGEQVRDKVRELIDANRAELVAKRYRFNTGTLMAEVRKAMKWADGKIIKEEMEKQVAAILGPKTAADGAKLPKAKAVKENDKQKDPDVQKSKATVVDDLGKPSGLLVGEAANFHKPGQNYMTEGYVVTPNTMNLMQHHLNVTGGRVMTRFPPEPNGILHIGHAKAINFNFAYAKSHGGLCYLRYDDTNPEKEEERFFTGIKDMVEWLGHNPWRVTHSSDYFQELYDFAIDLIKRGLAYVCHQESTEIKGHNPPPSPWRNRPVEESLALFEDMKRGKIDEGKATLRMKYIMEDGKMDPVAYRIKFVPHTRSGDEWCIYPTYDYTHCLCDSLENISHSLCTKEFQSRRSAYYWLCNALDVYCPVQWEYGRMNILYTVVSKRKIAKLIAEGIVKDWDDPRLYTLAALKRRGVPADAINKFCAKAGVTMSQTVLEPAMLDACVRDELNATAFRAMAALDPLKVSISNFPSDQPINVEIDKVPSDVSRGVDYGKHSVPLDRVLYIDRSDFKEVADKSYKRLAANQPVGLKHVGLVISVEEVIKDSSGYVTELKVRCDKLESVAKPKAFIQWVSHPITCEVRLYDRLFKHAHPEDPSEVPGGYVSDCNRDALHVISNAVVDVSVSNCQVGDRFQFERVGYFTPDYDSTPEKLIFNCTVRLREDTSK